ncbi:MFS transporter [Pelagicoccus mobilis]|uniref:MFS transporter n=1 Tax=Pelagicoccus mobilis TaxID=415221 RepID=A0A934S6Z0_9BACT|nr:MFS transporter [Pelagicoccus mobilis]MBK1880509.1 MFS transporter [Pelagicoccus mobilis]
MKEARVNRNLKKRDLWSFASGEGASSITMNGINNFGMLFYTQILGLSPELAGLALSIALVWDAISDPLMGTISDRTRSRFGSRHPYMLAGGVLLPLTFLALWFVPSAVRGEQALFIYLLVANICMKTAFTVFVVPYTALGFEISKTDDDRARVQGYRWGLNMITNIIFGGLAWILFFGDGVAEDGTRLEGTKIHENYLTMGSVLSFATLLIILFCVVATYKFAKKGLPKLEDASMSSHVRAFVGDLKDVYSNRFVWVVFGFFGIAQLAGAIVGQVQMFTYIEFMQFSAYEKTFVHTGGMVGFMLGSLLLGIMVKRWDKKKTGYFAMLVSSFGSLALLAIFKGGLMEPVSTPLFDIKGNPFHLSAVVFVLFQALWWCGAGILIPLATSMMADISLIERLKTGEVSEGRYAAGFSFFLKAASAIAVFMTGYILKGVGYVSGQETQAPETIDTLALMTFTVGPVLMLVSFCVLRTYPITHKVLEEYRAKYET